MHIIAERKELIFFFDDIVEYRNYAKQAGKNPVCISKYYKDA